MQQETRDTQPPCLWLTHSRRSSLRRRLCWLRPRGRASQSASPMPAGRSREGETKGREQKGGEERGGKGRGRQGRKWNGRGEKGRRVEKMEGRGEKREKKRMVGEKKGLWRRGRKGGEGREVAEKMQNCSDGTCEGAAPMTVPAVNHSFNPKRRLMVTIPNAMHLQLTVCLVVAQGLHTQLHTCAYLYRCCSFGNKCLHLVTNLGGTAEQFQTMK